jgi:hypothetical protein
VWENGSARETGDQYWRKSGDEFSGSLGSIIFFVFGTGRWRWRIWAGSDEGANEGRDQSGGGGKHLNVGFVVLTFGREG